MIKELKLGIKLIKYTYKFRQSVIMGMIFFALGLAFLMWWGGSFAGSAYWMTGGLMATGIYITVNASAMVQSSPLKKTLQISIPVIMNLCYYLMTYLLFLLIETLFWSVGGRAQDSGVLVLYGLLAFIFMVYNSYYKIFELATVFFFVVFLALIWGGEQLIRQMLAGLPSGIAGIIGLGEILSGALLQYCLALLTYRKPLSRRAVTQELRKQM